MVTETRKKAESGIKIYTRNSWNLMKSIFLIFTWIVLGFHLELVGPTMPILAANAQVDYGGMSSALASRAAGYLVANMLGAILQNIVRKHSGALLTCAFFLPAIAVFATPFAKSLVLMCVLFFLQGSAQGFTDLGGTNILLTMWAENAAAPLNAAHLGYGIGAVLVNLLVRPFLTERGLSNDTSTDYTSNIFIPYSITAVLCLLIGFGHLFFYGRDLKRERQRLTAQEVEYALANTDSAALGKDKGKKTSSYSPQTCGRGFFRYGLTLSTIFIFYTFFIGGNDQTFSKFFFSYLKSSQFDISAGAASWATILFWLSYSIGRLIGAIISVFISVDMCLNIVWFGGFCLAVSWFVFVWFINLTSTSLFVLGSMTGFVFSPIFPLSFGLFNQRLNVVPMLLALLLCGSAIGAITLQKIAGFVMDHNPKHFPTLLIICLLMSIVLYITSNVVFVLHERKRRSKQQPPATIDAAVLSENINDEEQQMSTYLTNQEDK